MEISNMHKNRTSNRNSCYGLNVGVPLSSDPQGEYLEVERLGVD